MKEYLYPEKENWSINITEVKNDLEELLDKTDDEIIDYINKTDECTIGTTSYNLIEKLISKLAKGTIRDSKEKAIVRLIKSIQPSDNQNFLRFLDKNKSILLNLISELNDTVFYYGGNNYTSFISALIKMYSSSKSFYEEKIKKFDIDLVKNEFSLYEKILLLEPETMVAPRSNDPAFIPQSSIYYKGKLNNDGLIDIKELTKTFKFGCASSQGATACDWSFSATYENDFVNGVDPLSPIIIVSTPSLDLVKTALDGVNQGINVYIVPAIYLEYANQKQFNKDVEDGIILTLDLVTIASSGPVAFATKVGKVRRILAIAELLGSSANIAVNNSELNKYPELQSAVNAFNTLLGIIGLKNLTKGVYKSMRGMSQSAKELINSNKSIRTLLLNELGKLKITTQQYAKLSPSAQKEWDKIKQFKQQLLKLLGKADDLAKAGTIFIAKSGDELKMFLNGLSEIPPFEKYTGNLYRTVGNGRDPLLTHYIPRGKSQRYSKIGEDGLFFSSSKEGNFQELKSWDVQIEGNTTTFIYKNVESNDLLDLTNLEVRKKMGVGFPKNRTVIN